MVERSKTLRSGRNLPWRRGFEPHSCQFLERGAPTEKADGVMDRALTLVLLGKGLRIEMFFDGHLRLALVAPGRRPVGATVCLSPLRVKSVALLL